jgi:hypothetical protein
VVELQAIVDGFARGMYRADSLEPVAHGRSGRIYQAGLGPHTERDTTRLVIHELRRDPRLGGLDLTLEVPYPAMPRNRCDLCVGDPAEWAVEIKMLRLMGDNGKPNDNILMHLLSPYEAHRSALTDCEKLLESGFDARKAILIFGYGYPNWPMAPAIEAFQTLARERAQLVATAPATIEGLCHPVHKFGSVYGWEITRR